MADMVATFESKHIREVEYPCSGGGLHDSRGRLALSVAVTAVPVLFSPGLDFIETPDRRWLLRKKKPAM